MIENLQIAKEILKKYHQEHLLYFYDELNTEEKETLVNQICNIDFEKIFNLYEASKSDELIPIKKLEPLKYTEKYKLSEDESTYFSSIGEAAIKNNKFAVVTMAGGQRYKTWI